MYLAQSSEPCSKSTNLMLRQMLYYHVEGSAA